MIAGHKWRGRLRGKGENAVENDWRRQVHKSGLIIYLQR